MHYFWKKNFWLIILANIVYFQLTSACIYTPQHTNLGCLCVHVPKFCHYAFNSRAILLCVGDFSQKIVLHRVTKINFD